MAIDAKQLRENARAVWDVVSRQTAHIDITAFAKYYPATFNLFQEKPFMLSKARIKALPYYVGSPTAYQPRTDGTVWAKSSLKDAIEQATEACRKDGQTKFVVKVVRIVSPTELPVKVEVVK